MIISPILVPFSANLSGRIPSTKHKPSYSISFIKSLNGKVRAYASLSGLISSCTNLHPSFIFICIKKIIWKTEMKMESHLTSLLSLFGTTPLFFDLVFLLLSHMSATFLNASRFRQYSQYPSNDLSCFAIFSMYGTRDLSHEQVLFECIIYSGTYAMILLCIRILFIRSS